MSCHPLLLPSCPSYPTTQPVDSCTFLSRSRQRQLPPQGSFLPAPACQRPTPSLTAISGQGPEDGIPPTHASIPQTCNYAEDVIQAPAHSFQSRLRQQEESSTLVARCFCSQSEQRNSIHSRHSSKDVSRSSLPFQAVCRAHSPADLGQAAAERIE